MTDYRGPYQGFRFPVANPWAERPAAPVIWSPVERQRLTRLQARFGKHRDLLSADELRRCRFCRWLLMRQRMGRG